MIILISGASHTGKTLLAQRLIEKYRYPCLSIDHLKMGLIRSGNTDLTPMSADSELTDYLWPIVREMIKTALENEQNMIIEGCYIPPDWKKDFTSLEVANIKALWLIMSEEYIRAHFDDILSYGNVIEKRLDNDISMDELICENNENLCLAKEYGINYLLNDREYNIEMDL